MMLRARPDSRAVYETDAMSPSSVRHVLHDGKAIGPRNMDSLMRVGALVTLVVQNSALALVMRYTRTSGQTDIMYIRTTAVVMAEALKFALSFVMQSKIEGSFEGVLKSILANTLHQPEQYLKMGVLALLYTVQNNLAYVAASHLDGPTYQLICQSKILITALLSVAILGRPIAHRQWISLGILTVGVGMVQLSESDKGGQVKANNFSGFFSAIMLCFCSGLGGVFFELMLKGTTTTSLWIRNIQLSSCSLLLGLGLVVLNDGDEVVRRGFFSGYSPMVWLCISLHSLGGLAVAMVIKYADNLVKCFATSISISMTCFISIAFLKMALTKMFVSGAIMVVCATYMYNTKGASRRGSTPYASLPTVVPANFDVRVDRRESV